MTNSRRTQADRTSASRAVLVNAAARMLSTQGFAKSTTALICQEAGVTTGTLHHHFSTKEALFWAVLDFMSEQFVERFRSLAETDEPAAHVADRMFEALWPIYSDGRYWAVWEINMGFRSDAALLEKLAQHRLATNRALHDVIQENDSLASETKALIQHFLPFAQIAMRGIFLETIFRNSASIDKQRDNFKMALRLLIEAQAHAPK